MDKKVFCVPLTLGGILGGPSPCPVLHTVALSSLIALFPVSRQLLLFSNMSSFLVTIGNTSIDSGELCAFFLTSLLGDPSMLWFMPQYCNTLFFQADASTEVVVLS